MNFWYISLPILAIAIYTWYDRICSYARKLSIYILRQGPIPQHIGVIMDGNRRFARKSHLGSVSQGHRAGSDTLISMLGWCQELGIKNVSVFAFAINNFSRSKEEVDGIMELAKLKLGELADHSQELSQYGVRIRLVGARHLLPEDVRAAIESAEQRTKARWGLTLNVCCPYSSTDEMTTAIRRAAEDAQQGKLEIKDINELVLNERLMIPSPDLDILIRTSGEIRFSNFMLWQTSKMAYIQFVDAFWPEFGFHHMARILLSWQIASKSIFKQKKR